MAELLHISHPFLTAEDFRLRVGRKLARLIKRLARKYPGLTASLGVEAVLLPLSVAWGMKAAAREGNQALIAHIDAALMPCRSGGRVVEPPGGCVTVEGKPFFFLPDEPADTRNFLWDGFAIFIENEPTGTISQPFFDLADAHQRKAYAVMGEDSREELSPEQGEEDSREELCPEPGEEEPSSEGEPQDCDTPAAREGNHGSDTPAAREGNQDCNTPPAGDVDCNGLVREIVDEVIAHGDTRTADQVELMLRRIDDRHGHVFASEISRLARATDRTNRQAHEPRVTAENYHRYGPGARHEDHSRHFSLAGAGTSKDQLKLEQQ